METWAVAFFDKIFLMAENKEAQKKADKKSTISNVLSECIETFFYAADDEIHELVTCKTVDYLKTSMPLNGADEMSVLLSNLVAARPSVLPRVLDVLIDEDLLLNKSSSEKLAYRLHLIAGAVQRSGEVSQFSYVSSRRLRTIVYKTFPLIGHVSAYGSNPVVAE
jgi:Proteasome-substrate-size regulator, mid region